MPLFVTCNRSGQSIHVYHLWFLSFSLRGVQCLKCYPHRSVSAESNVLTVFLIPCVAMDSIVPIVFFIHRVSTESNVSIVFLVLFLFCLTLRVSLFAHVPLGGSSSLDLHAFNCHNCMSHWGILPSQLALSGSSVDLARPIHRGGHFLPVQLGGSLDSSWLHWLLMWDNADYSWLLGMCFCVLSRQYRLFCRSQ